MESTTTRENEMTFTAAETSHAAEQSAKIIVAIKSLFDQGYSIEAAVKKIAIEAEIPYCTIRAAIGFALARVD